MVIFLIIFIAVLTFWTAFLMSEKNEEVTWMSRIWVIVTTGISQYDNQELKTLYESLKTVDVKLLILFLIMYRIVGEN